MKQAQSAFDAALARVDFRPNNILVMSNALADAHDQDQARIRSALSRQLIQPVHFMSNIEKLYEQGIRTFVEVGPKSVLTGLVRSILADRRFSALAIDASAGREPGLLDLASCLSALAASGYPVSLDRWETPAVDVNTTPRMRIPLNGANFRSIPRTDGKKYLNRPKVYGKAGHIPARMIDRQKRIGQTLLPVSSKHPKGILNCRLPLRRQQRSRPNNPSLPARLIP